MAPCKYVQRSVNGGRIIDGCGHIELVGSTPDSWSSSNSLNFLVSRQIILLSRQIILLSRQGFYLSRQATTNRNKDFRCPRA